MYTLQAKPLGMCAMKPKIQNKRIFPKQQAVEGIGDVVHVNVYESLTKRLDSIEEKLFQIETYMAVEPVTHEEVVPKPLVMESTQTIPEPEPLVMESTQTIPQQFPKNDENAKRLQDLKAQMDEATSDARRKALYARIMELSV